MNMENNLENKIDGDGQTTYKNIIGDQWKESASEESQKLNKELENELDMSEKDLENEVAKGYQKHKKSFIEKIKTGTIIGMAGIITYLALGLNKQPIPQKPEKPKSSYVKQIDKKEEVTKKIIETDKKSIENKLEEKTDYSFKDEYDPLMDINGNGLAVAIVYKDQLIRRSIINNGDHKLRDVKLDKLDHELKYKDRTYLFANSHADSDKILNKGILDEYAKELHNNVNKLDRYGQFEFYGFSIIDNKLVPTEHKTYVKKDDLVKRLSAESNEKVYLVASSSSKPKIEGNNLAEKLYNVRERAKVTKTYHVVGFSPDSDGQKYTSYAELNGDKDKLVKYLNTRKGEVVYVINHNKEYGFHPGSDSNDAIKKTFDNLVKNGKKYETKYVTILSLSKKQESLKRNSVFGIKKGQEANCIKYMITNNQGASDILAMYIPK